MYHDMGVAKNDRNGFSDYVVAVNKAKRLKRVTGGHLEISILSLHVFKAFRYFNGECDPVVSFYQNISEVLDHFGISHDTH